MTSPCPLSARASRLLNSQPLTTTLGYILNHLRRSFLLNRNRTLIKLILILHSSELAVVISVARTETYPEDCCDILKRQAPRVWEEEENHEACERAGYDEAEVEFPADVPTDRIS